MKLKLILLIALTVLTACDTTTWSGPGSDLSKTPQPGGNIHGAGASFGSWVNNAFGPASTIIPVKKHHPPLQGAEICVVEHPALACAVSDKLGRFDLYAIPTVAPVHLSISLRGYYSLLVPYQPKDGDFPNQPALEMPATVLQQVMYKQLSIGQITNTGGMSFMVIDHPQLAADPVAADHAEINTLLAGVAFRYRQVYRDKLGNDTYGAWSNPGSWALNGHELIYLDNDESPDADALHTSASGLAIAVNLKPGLYEIEADDTNSSAGFGTLQTHYHWRCAPIKTMPAGSARHRARTLVLADHLSDVRLYCTEQ